MIGMLSVSHMVGGVVAGLLPFAKFIWPSIKINMFGSDFDMVLIENTYLAKCILNMTSTIETANWILVLENICILVIPTGLAKFEILE